MRLKERRLIPAAEVLWSFLTEHGSTFLPQVPGLKTSKGKRQARG
jgi:hypothetical protein